jgi:hypothetical protein
MKAITVELRNDRCSRTSINGLAYDEPVQFADAAYATAGIPLMRNLSLTTD